MVKGVMTVDIRDSIQQTKTEFEKSFAAGDFYNKQTRDEKHLQDILDFLPLSANAKVLDLGTGSGYLSFAVAKRYPNVSVVGLDIVEKTLQDNREKAKEEKIDNLKFVGYDGVDFPFCDGEFDLVVSRYALHHFPKIQSSIAEVSRVLKRGGHFFVSDPAPNDNDDERFVDAYMQLKQDGHIKFYTLDEWESICEECGLRLEKSFKSLFTVTYDSQERRTHHTDLMN